MNQTSNSEYGKYFQERVTTRQQIKQESSEIQKIGLENIGNTCYINSILQCLINLPMMSVQMKTINPDILKRSSSLFQLFYNIWFQISQAKTKVDNQYLMQFKQVLASQHTQFNNMNQQDCIEFLHVFLDLTAQDGPIKNNLNIFHQLFQGCIQHTMKCSNCNRQSQNKETFINLSLYIPSSTSITNLIKDYLKNEVLVIQQVCQTCKKISNINKSSKISQLPTVLIIQLKRYDIQTKQSKQISIEQQLILNTSNYQLYAIIKHLGNSVHNGHYTCLIKQIQYWLNFNDLRVSEYPNRIVEDELNHSIDSYILFYCRV
ncbi:hypothetical protein pb186bvf_004850 [Paramecium bursaria]